MTRTALSMAALLTVGQVAPIQADAHPENADKTSLSDTQKLSYAIGVVFGNRLRHEANELDLELFAQGLRNSYQNERLILSDTEIKAAFGRYQEARDAARNQQQLAFEETAKANLETSQKFLAENADKPEVKTLLPGIQYQIIKAGEEGTQPSPNDKVTVHYQGKLLNGNTFDSSYAAGGPVEFLVHQGPSSWVKVLPNMNKGAQWTVWVAPEHGFGSGGAGPVGPNEVLEYHIELLKVEAQTKEN